MRVKAGEDIIFFNYDWSMLQWYNHVAIILNSQHIALTP